MYRADLWHGLARRGELHHLTAILADARVCFIGDASLHNLRHTPGFEHALVLEVSQGSDINTVCETIRALAGDGVDVFGFSCGPLMASILIDTLWADPHLRHQCWFIDFGRLWEHTATTPAST